MVWSDVLELPVESRPIPDRLEHCIQRCDEMSTYVFGNPSRVLCCLNNHPCYPLASQSNYQRGEGNVQEEEYPNLRVCSYSKTLRDQEVVIKNGNIHTNHC